jgi:hypothetical protein
MAGKLHIRSLARKKKLMQVFRQSARYCCPILTKTGMCPQILVKLANAKCRKNTISLSRLLHWYRQTEQLNRLFRRVANLPKNAEFYLYISAG